MIFNRYGIRKPAKSTANGDNVRIIPPDIAKPAATAMFRDFISLQMDSDSGSNLYHRENRDGQPDAVEAGTMLIRDSATCHRLQTEGDPPKDEK